MEARGLKSNYFGQDLTILLKSYFQEKIIIPENNQWSRRESNPRPNKSIQRFFEDYYLEGSVFLKTTPPFSFIYV